MPARNTGLTTTGEQKIYKPPKQKELLLNPLDRKTDELPKPV
jgi:hypothetical protein